MPHVTVVLFVVALLGAAYLFAKVAAHAGIPPAVAVTLVGVAAGGMLPATHEIHFGPVLLGVFLPALIFESAWDMDAAALRRAAGTVLVLAVPGTLLTMAAVALATGAWGALGWGAALTLGAILGATDPIAVLALFRSLHLPADLLAIVEGESIGNDAVALVLVQLIVPFAFGASAASDVVLAVAKFFYMGLTGIGTGIFFAYAAKMLLGARSPAVWILPVTVLLAYSSYAAASAVGASSILAVAAAGITLRSRLRVGARADARVERFWDLAALLANSIVFLLVGFTLDLERIFHEPLLFVAALAGTIVARAILAYGLVRFPAASGRTGWDHAIALAGLRGGLSVAMALGLPQNFPQRAQVIDSVFAVVFVTLVIQGWALAPVLRRALPSRRVALPR
jgi:CPA1 family monovalent cation:H+ antiporter